MTRYWERIKSWFCEHWQWVVAGLGTAAAFIGVLTRVRRPKPRADISPVSSDPSLALGPLADIGKQVDKIDAVVREEAARETAKSKEAHDAIDAADSISAVNDVLYDISRSGDGK